MQTMTWWENIILGVLVLLIVFWFQAGAKVTFERSKNTPSDWKAVLLPLGLVVLLVFLLIAMV